MNRVTAKLLFFIFLILSSSKTIFAEDAVVSASVVSNITSVNPPILIAPNDNSATNNPREPLVWKRPLIITNPLHHYDVYVDGALFASSISDSIINQSYYFYNIHREDDTFFLNLNTDLSEGYHTWSVTIHDSVDNTASSETRTYYIDSTTPFINLQKVEDQTLNWNTQDYSTIPDANQRDLSVTTPNPLLKGSVEPYANLQIILMCPQNIPNCSNQSYQGNYATGDWQHRFYGLIKGLVYTVYLSATDAGGNSVIFPEFYLAYGVVTPLPKATITPIPTTSIAPTIPTPIVTPEIIVPPEPFIPVPPEAPAPPVFKDASLVTPKFDSQTLLLILMIIGLPLHLLMTMYGTGTRVSSVLKFLFILLFPFLGKKEFQTTPFTTIDFYDPEKLDSSWTSIISDIKGFYSLSSQIPKKIFAKIFCINRFWKNIIIEKEILPITCLIPLLYDSKIPQNRLQTSIMSIRSLPLVLAVVTSAISFIIYPNYLILIYLYLSLQLVFSEYIYSHLQK